MSQLLKTYQMDVTIAWLSKGAVKLARPAAWTVLMVTIVIPTRLCQASIHKWGVGTLASVVDQSDHSDSGRTGLSFMFRPSLFQGYHLTGRIQGRSYVAFELANLYYFEPWNLLGTGFELYSGIGLLGEADKSSLTEQYFLTFPLGVEWNWPTLPISVFADGAAVVGPLLTTQITPRVVVGLRALL